MTCAIFNTIFNTIVISISLLLGFIAIMIQIEIYKVNNLFECRDELEYFGKEKLEKKIEFFKTKGIIVPRTSPNCINASCTNCSKCKGKLKLFSFQKPFLRTYVLYVYKDKKGFNMEEAHMLRVTQL